MPPLTPTLTPTLTLTLKPARRIVTEATRKLSPTCPAAVRAAIRAVIDADAATITNELRLCAPLSADYEAGKLQLLQRIMNQFADTVGVKGEGGDPVFGWVSSWG